MPPPITPLARANGILRSFGAPFRLRQHRRSRWVTVTVPLPAEWVERYQLGGEKDEQRLAELRTRYRPKFVNEEGQPFDPERDQAKRCDNNERLGAICCHKLRCSDDKLDFELRHKLYARVEVAAAEGRRKAQKRKERCVPYDLRHAYAIRVRETTCWSYADVAAVMGHSPEVHRCTCVRSVVSRPRRRWCAGCWGRARQPDVGGNVRRLA